VARVDICEPGGRFFDLVVEIKAEECRQGTDHEQDAPVGEDAGAMEVGKERCKQQRSQQIAADVAFLQQAGEESAAFRRQGFQGQRRADTPDAAHGDAKQRTADQEAR
jgi:hypothetical protein